MIIDLLFDDCYSSAIYSNGGASDSFNLVGSTVNNYSTCATCSCLIYIPVVVVIVWLGVASPVVGCGFNCVVIICIYIITLIHLQDCYF